MRGWRRGVGTRGREGVDGGDGRRRLAMAGTTGDGREGGAARWRLGGASRPRVWMGRSGLERGRNGEGGGDASVTDGEAGGRRGDEAAEMTMDRDRAKEEGEENRAHIKHPPHTHTFVPGHCHPQYQYPHLYQGIASPGISTLICTRPYLAPVQMFFLFRAITKTTFVSGQTRSGANVIFIFFLLICFRYSKLVVHLL